MDSDNALEVTHVSKGYWVRKSKNTSDSGKKFPTKVKVPVLNDVSFNVKKGEVVGIIGRNGAGKSTLLSMISGIIHPDSGKISCNGAVASILELGMGFQQDMSGRENIYLKGQLYGFNRKRIDSKIDKIIEYSELGEFIDSPLRTYSTGMIGKLAFSIMVNVEAEIMLVDEVLSTGDLIFNAKASVHFKQMALTGKTILVITHNLSMVESLCERVIWIDNHKIREDGAAKVVCAHYKKDMMDSIEVLESLSEAGNADAQYALACKYRDGDGVDINLSKSEQLFQMSARGGSVDGLLNYGDLLSAKNDADSKQQARDLFRLAANKNSLEAMRKVAAFYVDDISLRTSLINNFEKFAECGSARSLFEYADLLAKCSTTPDERKGALSLFIDAANQGNVEAQYRVGSFYHQGWGVKKDDSASIEWFKKAASNGHLSAQVYLGNLYYDGILTRSNYSESLKWFTLAAKQGDQKSAYYVATMYLEGKGVDPHPELAKKWFNILYDQNIMQYYALMSNYLAGSDPVHAFEFMSRAQAVGNKYALRAMGQYCKDGRGTPVDVNSARHYFNEAALQGNVIAIISMINLYISGSIKNAEAYSFALTKLKELAYNGNVDAARRLGKMYYEGIGVDIDYQTALDLFSIGAKYGDAPSYVKLAEIYRDGRGVSASVDVAIDFYCKALLRGDVYAGFSILRLCSRFESDSIIANIVD